MDSLQILWVSKLKWKNPKNIPVSKYALCANKKIPFFRISRPGWGHNLNSIRDNFYNKETTQSKKWN